MRRARAFTLIELLVVVAVVAILLALVGPSMGDLLATQRVRNINAQLITDLQFARSEAARRNVSVLVWFRSNTTLTCYTMTMPLGEGNCDCRLGEGASCTGFEEIRTVSVPTSTTVRLTPNYEALQFDRASGRVIGAAFQADVVSSRHGKLRTTVNAAGRPTVCSPDGSIRDVPQCPS